MLKSDETLTLVLKSAELIATARAHADEAQQLLAKIAQGTPSFGSFAPAAATMATAAQAHATLALAYAQLAEATR